MLASLWRGSGARTGRDHNGIMIISKIMETIGVVVEG